MALWEILVGPVVEIAKTAMDKIWMDKGEQEKLEFSKEELVQKMGFAIQEMALNGELKKLEHVFKESQAQRDYALDQFGSAKTLKDAGWMGRIILLGRASIRWVITLAYCFFVVVLCF